MKRKPKMRVMRTCLTCGHCDIQALDYGGYSYCGKYKVHLSHDVCQSKAEKCQDFSLSKTRKLEMEPDPDAHGNWFCINCKWYAGGKEAGGECMFNPPVMVSDMGSVRPVTYPYDYCSRWEKEEE